ncbi:MULTISPECIES: single-stranded DNA-binding protein [unclassified Campylobacter]|uniref:single-stranded DNA-binding protein n=1 Tax=unclassified Campylobacter TaxID=2593542 RepID=UPI0012382641|nr:MULTISPECIES: single-stranded DNA-binding protein [unclassified Campylobacter]KAA6225256.1 single-stranded DNA-binding protein [Campylobacter sp. LR185c]KAA6227672.1 single-stranded DNA-binding protein [Campylobacter sp. LR286c]KAA6227774.1 single-stranded DNA-binding protein [Campylobacter sp. LR196d]KAA6229966.1 single-stranded DNA-binding protein [Campylobacter sp. LR264d]KAA6233616.1 single-stranded DNA-binding protein [Campylobacter sp. LR291e]
MFNKVVLVGNLTRDIEVRYIASGTAIGSSAIAVTRKYTANTGEKRDETCFIDISFFGRTAEIANQYLRKGSKILIDGRLRFEQWVDQNGQNRSKHSVYVETMEMLGGGQGGGNNYSPNSSGYNNNYMSQGNSYDPYGEDRNFRQNNYNANFPKGPSPQQNLQNQNQEKLKEIDVDAYDDEDKELPF